MAYDCANKTIRKLKAEAQLAGVFPTDLDLPLLAQELFERFFATFGVPQGTNLELLGEAGNVDDDVLETWCKDSISFLNK